ncbi:hypothetical protein E2C01_039288 [Portunus trituberculatus]|uniref:Uncharacterized protein n=1 Tax=Portunus trituberculatus TaxID=210409 RepID=A0A5B7FML2_PORTR|nr:hypothetical protein [Portunus trituberculatus]
MQRKSGRGSVLVILENTVFHKEWWKNGMHCVMKLLQLIMRIALKEN